MCCIFVISCSEQEKGASPQKGPAKQKGPDSKVAYSHGGCNDENAGTWYRPSKCEEHCTNDSLTIDVTKDFANCTITFCWWTECNSHSDNCFEVQDDEMDYDAINTSPNGDDRNFVGQLCMCCGAAENGGGPPYEIACAYPLLEDSNGDELYKFDPSSGETEIELPDYKTNCCPNGVLITYDPDATQPNNAHITFECRP